MEDSEGLKIEYWKVNIKETEKVDGRRIQTKQNIIENVVLCPFLVFP